MRGSRLVVAVAVFSFKVSALPISEIPSLVEKKSHDVKAAIAEVEAADSAISAARAKHFPHLSSKTTYIHLGSELVAKPPPITVGALTIALPPVELQKQDVLFSNLILKVPVFAGGRISAGVSAAEGQKSEAEAMKHHTEEEKIKESLERYFQVHLAREATRVLVNLKDNLDRLIKIGEALVRTGVGTKFSVLQIQVSQREVVARLAQARSKSDLADIAFKTSIGSPITETITYESPLVKLNLPTRRDDFKQRALTKRSELEILKAKGMQVDALKAAKSGEMLPTIYAVGAKQMYSSNRPVLEPDWAVGVVMELPLTGFLESLPERERAVHLEQKLDALNKKAREDIPLQVEKIYSEALAADESYQAIQEAEGLAQEALRLAEVRFKNGDGSAVELLKASADLEKAEIQTWALKEEFNRKLIELYYASGSIRDYVSIYSSSLKGH